MSTTFQDIGHAEKILLKLWKQCESEELCDAVLIAGTERKRIPVHSSVLSAATEYFNGMFASSMRESITKEVDMSHVDGDILQRLVEYCYTGCVVIDEEIVVELLKTANMLLLVNVVTACGNVLTEQLHPSNCLGLALLADQHCCETFLEKARYYSLKNFLEVCEMREFLRLDAKQLSQLLGSNDLCVQTEEDVFNSLMRWIEHDRTERVKHLAELLKLVRMPLLERSFLMEQVKPICASNGCLDIYMAAIEWHLSSGGTISSENKLIKRRNSHKILIAISNVESDNKMFIHYYCPQRNEWMKWLKSLEYRDSYGVALMENYLFIIGGLDAGNNVLNSAISLNLRTMAIEPMTPLNEHRAGCSAAALNGILYVVGGLNSQGALNSVEKWNAETNKWDVVASMSETRSSFGIAVLNKKLYAIGAFNGNTLNSVERYDPIQNSWQFIESMGESRKFHGVAVAKGKIYAVGGSGSTTVERYDPETKKWTPMSSLRRLFAFDYQHCTSHCDKVLLGYFDGIEEFDDATNGWKKIMTVPQTGILDGIFSYSDALLTSEFDKS